MRGIRESLSVTIAAALFWAFLPGVLASSSPRSAPLAIDDSMSAKRDARDLLAAAVPGTNKTAQRFGKAIDRVDTSLTPGWWINADYVTDADGLDVFQEEQLGAVQLELVLSEGTPADVATAQEALDLLVEADRLLARYHLDIAALNGGIAQHLNKGEDEMAFAAAAAGNGDFSDAINHYRKAWHRALKARAGLNVAPIAYDDSGTTDEDTPLAVPAPGTLDNDIDLDGDALFVSGSDAASAGGAAVSVAADGSWTYDSGALYNYLAVGESVDDTFQYTAADGISTPVSTATATVTVTVTGVNDAPTANDDTGATDEDTVLTIDALDNDTDPDLSDVLSVLSVDATSAGGAPITDNGDGTFDYDPTVAYNSLPVGATATDTFGYVLTDPHGATDTATVTVEVTGVNDDPDAVNDGSAAAPFAATTEDAAVTTPNVLANDTDPDTGDTVSVGSADAASALGAAITNNGDGTFGYDPTGSAALQSLDAGDVEPDVFDYTAVDGNGGSDDATVTIEVTGVNDRPIARNDSHETSASAPLTVASLGVLANDSDVDEDDVLGVTVLVTKVQGVRLAGAPSRLAQSDLLAAVTLSADGGFTYDPTGSPVLQLLPNGVSIVDTFSYLITDLAGASSTARVVVTVTGGNGAPTANPDTVFTSGGTATILLTGSDPDGDALTFTIDSGPSAGSLGAISQLTPTSAEVVYTSTSGDDDVDSFVFRVNDGNGGTATATVDINPSDDPVDPPPPGNVDAQDVSVETAEDIPVSVLLAVNAPDGTTVDITIVAGSGPGNGSLGPINGPDPGALTARVVYTPDAGFTGTDNFDFEACDTLNPADCDTATATIEVETAGDVAPPSASDQQVSTPVDTPIQITLNGSPSAPPPSADIDAQDVTVDTTTDTPVTVPLAATAPTGTTLSFTVLSGPSNGSLGAINLLGPQGAEVVYTPGAGFTGSDSFVFQACDEAVRTDCDSATATVNVAPPGPGAVVRGPATRAAREYVIGATVAGSTADADGNGAGDNHNALPGAAPVLASAGVDATGGPGSNGTMRFHMEWNLGTLQTDGIEPEDVAGATVVLTTTKGSVDSLDTFFYASSAGADLLLTDSDFETAASQVTGVRMPVHLGPTGIQGTFSFDVTGHVRSALGEAAATLTVQGRVDESLAGGGFLRGLQIHTTATGNQDSGITPVLIVTTEDDASVQETFSIEVLPLFGSLVDSTGAPVTAPGDLPDRAVTYTPNSGFVGNDSFSFAVRNSGGSSTGSVFVGVGDAIGGGDTTLTVVLAGAGNGTVTSNPAAIVCPGACSADFAANSGVVLQARPDDAFSSFGGWSGCGTSTNPRLTVVMTTSQTCTATFNQVPASTVLRR